MHTPLSLAIFNRGNAHNIHFAALLNGPFSHYTFKLMYFGCKRNVSVCGDNAVTQWLEGNGVIFDGNDPPKALVVTYPAICQ